MGGGGARWGESEEMRNENTTGGLPLLWLSLARRASSSCPRVCKATFTLSRRSMCSRCWWSSASSSAIRSAGVMPLCYTCSASLPDLLPALDRMVVGDPVIGPAQLVFGLLEAVLNPGAPAVQVAHCLLDLAGQVGHDVPRRLGGLADWVGGELEKALPITLAPPEDHLTDEAGGAAPVGKDTGEGVPAVVPIVPARSQPDDVV